MDDYQEWLVSRGLDNKTIRIYVSRVTAVQRLCDHYEWNIDNLTATQARIISQGFPNTPSSRRQLRTALQHWWDHRQITGPAKAIRVPTPARGQYRGLEPDEAKRLAKTAQGWWPEGGAVLVGLYLGARREEIAGLQWPNFDRRAEWVTIHGKHNRLRMLPVHPKLRKELLPRMTAFPYMFPGSRGRSHVSAATIWNWVHVVCDTAGIERISPHQLRHTSIATINDKTQDLRTAQDFAGHARPETTAIYTRSTTARMLSAVEALDFLD